MPKSTKTEQWEVVKIYRGQVRQVDCYLTEGMARKVMECAIDTYKEDPEIHHVLWKVTKLRERKEN